MTKVTGYRIARAARRLGAIAILLALPGFGASRQGADLASHSVGAWGIDFTDQDRSVRPGDDFYRYQNGAWLDRTELGPARAMAAYWRDLRVLAPRRLSAVLDELAADRTLSPTSREGKAATFYRSFMDTARVEALGVGPLGPELDAIRAVTTRTGLAALLGRMAGPGTVRLPPSSALPPGFTPFLVNVVQDQLHPDRYAAALGQGGLLLPGPEYYLEAQFADVRTAYIAYAARMLSLIGWPEPERRAREILDFETGVARVSWSHERMLDFATWNPMTVTELAGFAPGFDWRAFLAGAELGMVSELVVDAKGAFPGIAAALAAAPLEVLQARTAFAVADAAAGNLNEAMRQASLDFRGRLLGNGGLFGSDRAVRGEKAVETGMSDALAAVYVARWSSPEVKTRVEAIAERMRGAFDSRLAALSWLSPAGRAGARAKVARLRFKVGFPDCFDDYRGLEIRDGDLYGNVRRAAAYDWRRQVRNLGRPFDRAAWSLTPEYPNYNFLPSTNTIEIPAALLVPPFFDPAADEAVNYGSVGALIGEMMVVGFTSRGVRYDGQGHFAPWLPARDSAALAERSARLATAYSAVEPLPGMHLKGELLVDEAVGDLGGIAIALDAYHLSLGGKPAPLLDGTTGDQRFFLARAQMWRAKFGAAFIRTQIATGANAPPFMRVNGPLPNLDAWYDAFGVGPGEKLYLAPAERVRIW